MRYPRETVEQVVELYYSGMSADEIAELVGVVRQTVFNMLDREGVRKIDRRTSEPKLKSKAKCPKCGAKDHNPNAAFCYKCGTDIRSPVLVALERLTFASGNAAKICPSSEADELISAINNLREVLKKESII